MNGSLRIFPDFDTLNEALARYWQGLAEAAITARGTFHVALAGGGTPRQFYQRLAKADLYDRLPWGQTHCYFGDERCVPQDHADSNFRMARESLLFHVPIPRAQIHPMFDPAFSPDENAAHYASLISQQLPQNSHGQAVFDLILLGIGDDGHTASLFPETEILEERDKLVAAQFVEKHQAWRISLTFLTINAAQNVALLVAGSGKAEIMAAIVEDQSLTPTFPVQRVNPEGQLQWFLDCDAARLLPAASLE